MLKIGVTHSKLSAVIIILGALVIAWTLDSVLSPMITSTDLNVSATMVAKDMNPTLYPRDNLFATDELVRFYTPLYRWIVKQSWQLTGSFEGGLILITPFVLGTYLVAMFSLLWRVTRHVWISLFLTVISAHYHPTVGAGLWGVAGSSEMAPRILFMPFTPFFTLVFIKLLEKPNWRHGAILGLGLGLAANLHPVSGIHLLALFSVWLLVIQGHHHQGWQTFLAFALATLVGALPVTWNYLQNSSQVVGSDVSFATFSKIVAERYPMPFYPPVYEWPLFNLQLTRPTLDVLVGLYLAMALAGGCFYLWGRSRWSGVTRWAWLGGGLITVSYGCLLALFNTPLLFGAAALYMIYCFWSGQFPKLTGWLLTVSGLIILYAFVGYYLLTFLWQTFEVWSLTSLLVEFARAGNFIYLPMYVLAGLALTAGWLVLKAKLPQPVNRRLVWGELLFVGVMGLSLFGPLAPWLASLEILPARNLLNPANLQAQPTSLPPDAELYAWVRQNTSSDALFYGCFGSETMTYFRRKAQRSISHNWKDLAYNVHTRATLVSAYTRFRNFEAACQNFQSTVTAAHTINADYILASRADAADFLNHACFVNEKYAVFALKQCEP